ncbi:hypothetical protein DRP53_05805, partial [candidate division WOR-3 bacterium]
MQAVKRYLLSGSLHEVALAFNIHPRTLRRWIKRYRDGGAENLKRKKINTRHPKRFAPSIEKKIIMLKEKKPSLTLLEAQNILNESGIKISIHGIWNIWRRYGGFHKIGSHWGAEGGMTSEIEDGLKRAERMVNKGAMKEAAQIINALPSCLGNDILKRLPDRFLSLPKRVEKLDLTFGKVAFRETMRKAKILRKEAESKNLFYTAIKAGLIELSAMENFGHPEKRLIFAKRLLKMLKRKSPPDNTEHTLHFFLLIEQGRALADLGRTRDVLQCLKKCEDLCRYLRNAKYYRNIASLYSSIGFYKKSRRWIKKSLECSNDTQRGISYTYLSANLTIAGEYRAARKVLKGIEVDVLGFQPLSAIINAYCFLGAGKIQEAIKHANEALLTSRDEEIIKYLLTSSLIFAYCSCALNEKTKAIFQLNRSIRLIKKHGIREYEYLCDVLLGLNPLPHDATLNPTIKLALLLRRASKSLKIKDYRKAYHYASTQKLMGLFHRLVLFFPEPVRRFIARGKDPGLPKALLNLPVFRTEIPVYHLKFLGPPRIYRNGKLIRDHLPPKEAAFLIHLALRKGSIPLPEIYDNFWPESKSPERTLSHFLVSIRKHLKLTSRELYISQRKE